MLCPMVQSHSKGRHGKFTKGSRLLILTIAMAPLMALKHLGSRGRERHSGFGKELFGIPLYIKGTTSWMVQFAVNSNS